MCWGFCTLVLFILHQFTFSALAQQEDCTLSNCLGNSVQRVFDTYRFWNPYTILVWTLIPTIIMLSYNDQDLWGKKQLSYEFLWKNSRFAFAFELCCRLRALPAELPWSYVGQALWLTTQCHGFESVISSSPIQGSSFLLPKVLLCDCWPCTSIFHGLKEQFVNSFQNTNVHTVIYVHENAQLYLGILLRKYAQNN